MSWDFSMSFGDKPCPTCGRADENTDLETNYTYNVSPMFYDALDSENGIRALNGKTGAECQPILDAAIARMKADPPKYEAMESREWMGELRGSTRVTEAPQRMVQPVSGRSDGGVVTKCDHIRHQWRGVDLPCATPGCVEGTVASYVRVLAAPGAGAAEMLIAMLEGTDSKLIRENWDGGWGWRLA